MIERTVAVIPARSGSVRIQNKNIAKIGRWSLIERAIVQASQSNVFDDIFLLTDSSQYLGTVEQFDITAPYLRSSTNCQSHSPDIEWLTEFIDYYRKNRCNDDFVIAILRPTSPFRKPETIAEAVKLFWANISTIDSVRAVKTASEHPGKMWLINEYDNNMMPMFGFSNPGAPWHSSQTATLPKVFVQTASIEVVSSEVISRGTISGYRILPLVTEGFETIDINTDEDLEYARYLSSRLGL